MLQVNEFLGKFENQSNQILIYTTLNHELIFLYQHNFLFSKQHNFNQFDISWRNYNSHFPKSKSCVSLTLALSTQKLFAVLQNFNSSWLIISSRF